MVLAPAPRSDDREASGRLAATQMENAGCTWPRTANVPGRVRFRPSQFLTLPGRRGSRRADSIRSLPGLVGSLPIPSGLRETESLMRVHSAVEPTPATIFGRRVREPNPARADKFMLEDRQETR